MTTVFSGLETLVQRLTPLSDTPELDSQVLFARVMNRPRSWLAAHMDEQIEVWASSALETCIHRLEGGEPLPYVLGEWEFFSLPFLVNPSVLIPRPETELLVEEALTWLRRRTQEMERPEVLDIGTGCGCIAIALAVNLPGIKVVAADISPAALEVARENALKNKVSDRIDFVQADLIPEAVERPSLGVNPQKPFDLIVGNLPYIPTETLHELPVYEREPSLALDGGLDGLELIRRLLPRIPEILSPSGLVLLEIEASEGPAALTLACDTFEKAEIHLHQDLAGRDRLLEIQLFGNGSDS